MQTPFPIRLVDQRELAPTVFHYAFVRDDGIAIDFVPGQFIQIHFDNADGTPAKRSYSVATAHDHAMTIGEAVEFAVSFVPGGRATALFQSLTDGDRIQCSGPYGKFVLNERDTNSRYLLIGTGTGITPYRSMLPQIAKLIAQRGIEVVLLQGARTRSELLYATDFAAFAQQHSGFTYMPCLSRESLDKDAIPGANLRHGYVQQFFGELQLHGEGKDIAYLCGNPNMVDAAFAQLKETGMTSQHIRREKYVSNA